MKDVRSTKWGRLFGKDDLIRKDLTLIPFSGPLPLLLGWALGRAPENEVDLKLPVRFFTGFNPN